MSKQLFVRRNLDSDTPHGPYGLNELRALASNGQLQQTDLVSVDGKKWYPATKIQPPIFPEVPHLDPNADKPNDAFGALPEFAEAEAPTPVRAFRSPPPRPRPQPADTKPTQSLHADATPKVPVFVIAGVGGGFVLLLLLAGFISLVSSLFGPSEKEFATNSSEPHTTSEWIALMRESYSLSGTAIRMSQKLKMERQEVDKAVNFVDFDPAVTEVLFDVLTDPERRISDFARRVLSKASFENPPDSDVIYEHLESTDDQNRRIATQLLILIPGGAEDNKGLLEANLTGDLRIPSLACLAVSEGGAKTYLQEFLKLNQTERTAVLATVASHPHAARLLPWFSSEYNEGYTAAAIAMHLDSIPSETRNAFAVEVLDRSLGSSLRCEKVKKLFADIDAGVADELVDRLSHEDVGICARAACALNVIGKKLGPRHATGIVDKLPDLADESSGQELLGALSTMGPKASSEARRLVLMVPEIGLEDNVCDVINNIGVNHAELSASEMVGLLSQLMDVISSRAGTQYISYNQPGLLLKSVSSLLQQQQLDAEASAMLKSKIVTWKLWLLRWDAEAANLEKEWGSKRVTVYVKGEYDAARSAETQNEYKKTVSQLEAASRMVRERIEELEPLLATS